MVGGEPSNSWGVNHSEHPKANQQHVCVAHSLSLSLLCWHWVSGIWVITIFTKTGHPPKVPLGVALTLVFLREGNPIGKTWRNNRFTSTGVT